MGGAYTEQPAWVIYVKEKILTANLNPGTAFPSEAGGLPTDVQVEFDARDFRLCGAADATRYRSPLTGGIQISPAGTVMQVHIGTLGCFARKNDTRDIVLLSNYHILYCDGAAKGDSIFQPGGATHPDTDSIATIDNGSIGGQVDCAIAILDNESSSTCCCKRPIDYRQKITNSYDNPGISVAGTRPPAVGTIVYKTGIHGHTTGKIVGVNKNITGAIDYSSFNMTIGNSFSFTGQIIIVSFDEGSNSFTPTIPFLEEGDSGICHLRQCPNGDGVGLCHQHRGFGEYPGVGKCHSRGRNRTWDPRYWWIILREPPLLPSIRQPRKKPPWAMRR